METTVFNPVQQHLLTMFAFDGSEERLKEVKAVLFNYFQQKMDQRLDELWDSGILDQKRLDELRTKHLRRGSEFNRIFAQTDINLCGKKN